jgi:hypothetical protein
MVVIRESFLRYPRLRQAAPELEMKMRRKSRGAIGASLGRLRRTSKTLSCGFSLAAA